MSATLVDPGQPDVYLYIDGDGDDARPQRMRVRGHNVLVKLRDRPTGEFMVGDQNAAGPISREAEMMLEAFHSATFRNWATVLAVGPKCDTPRTTDEMEPWKNSKRERRETGRKWRIPRCLNNHLQPGDIVCCEHRSVPDRLWNRLPCGPDTVLLDEAHITLKIPKEEVQT